MPHTTPALFVLPAVLLLQACAHQSDVAIEGSRADQSALYFYNEPVESGPVIDQVAALSESADALVRASTVQGAIIGAAVGCGAAVAAGSTVRRCVAQAVVGGVGGAVIGNRVGEQQVSRRLDLVATDDVVRQLQGATNQVDQIAADLPSLLARQEADLNTLTMQLIRNEITQEEHDLAVLKIEAERLDIAEALDMSARDARAAARNLQAAADRGQEGLDWHIQTSRELADEVESARSSFTPL